MKYNLDDTTLLVRSKSIVISSQTFQWSSSHLEERFMANRLSLNIGKTKVMLISGKQSPFRNFSLDNKDNRNISMDNADTINYLIEINSHLTFEAHTNKLLQKVNQRTKILWKMRAYINESLAKYLYTTLINNLFAYCDFINYGCSTDISCWLQVAQNGALRAIKNCKIEYLMVKLHDELEIDYLCDSHKKSTAKMVYQGIHNLGPMENNNMFEMYQLNHPLRSESQRTPSNKNKNQTG